MNNCGNCANYNTEGMCHTDICGECFVEGQNGHISGKPSKWKPLPLSNADRIRAMTDEELAYWMTHLHEDGHCLNERCQIFQDKTCEECVIDWLKQPAEVDHETC